MGSSKYAFGARTPRAPHPTPAHRFHGSTAHPPCTSVVAWSTPLKQKSGKNRKNVCYTFLAFLHKYAALPSHGGSGDSRVRPLPPHFMLRIQHSLRRSYSNPRGEAHRGGQEWMQLSQKQTCQARDCPLLLTTPPGHPQELKTTPTHNRETGGASNTRQGVGRGGKYSFCPTCCSPSLASAFALTKSPPPPATTDISPKIFLVRVPQPQTSRKGQINENLARPDFAPQPSCTPHFRKRGAELAQQHLTPSTFRLRPP